MTTTQLAQNKAEGLCYFCGKPVKDSPHTVNGKPEDHKVCPQCFDVHRSAILGARARIKAFEHIFG